MRQRGHFLIWAMLLLAASAGPTPAADLPAWQHWVLKIDVVRNDGTRDSGSGVRIASDRLLTNCHVVRNASQITASRGPSSWPAHLVTGDAYRDLCLLDLPGSPGQPPAIAAPAAVRVGAVVYAVGYSGGEFGASKGRIKGLYNCPCASGKVIQTSAAFSPGASGGGLFTAAGELVGILTFKSRSGGAFNFALPVGWMKQVGQLAPADLGPAPFWQNPSHGTGYFLAACDLEARKKWAELSALAAEWTQQVPADPQAWMASGRANLGLGRRREAAADFRKVLELDPSHAEAQWELQTLDLQPLGP